jgi:hypothetical protein
MEIARKTLRFLMRKLVIFIILIIFTISYGENYFTNFNQNPYWVTSDWNSFHWSDTSFTDSDGKTIAGVIKIKTVTGDATYTYEDLNSYNIRFAPDTFISFSAQVNIEDVQLYSAVFMGLSDNAYELPTESSSAKGLMVGIGKDYDGFFFGLYSSDGFNYNFKDSINANLLSEGKTYFLSCTTTDFSAEAKLIDYADYSVVATLSIPFNYFNFIARGIDYFTVTIKGYTNEHALGYETFKGNLNSLNILESYIPISVNNEKHDQSIEKEGLTASPNPFKASTRITVKCNSKWHSANLKIFNIKGKLVKEYNNTFHSFPSTVTVNWNASNLPSGTYIARLILGNKTYTKYLVLLK